MIGYEWNVLLIMILLTINVVQKDVAKYHEHYLTEFVENGIAKWKGSSVILEWYSKC